METRHEEESLKPFAYQVLRPKQIRLLYLVANGKDLPIGRLEHVSFTIARGLLSGRYNALSYSWGTDEAIQDLKCNGAHMKIRKNLAQALVHLAQANYKKPIWIDAICINQQDKIEKLQQIQMMPKIYENAAMVLVWLGEETPDTSSVKETILTAIDRMKTIPSTARDKFDTSLKENFLMAIDKMKPPSRTVRSETSESKAAIDDILTRTWWGRVWTLQETVLAQRIKVLVGGQTIPWELLEKLVRTMILAGLCPAKEAVPDGYNALSAIPDIEACRASNHGDFFKKLIHICRQRNCFDPRDRVHGILGMVPMYRIDEKIGIRHIKRAMKSAMEATPGAEHTVADVYIPFTVFMLQTDMDLQGLSMVESKVRDPSLPSWCPDFHQQPEATMLAQDTYWGFKYSYRAGSQGLKTTPPSWTPERPKELILNTYQIDKLELIVDGQWSRLTAISDLETMALAAVIKQNKCWLAACKEAATNTSRKSGSNEMGDAAAESFHRALIADQADRGFTWDVDRLLQSLQQMEQLLAAEHAQNARIKLLSSVAQSLRAISHACVGRRFCITKDGRLCLAPASAQKGDSLCLIKCATVPFVCRPECPGSDKQLLVGEAYVHGCMRGEVIARGIKWEKSTFV